jgi:hypothetical protein
MCFFRRIHLLNSSDGPLFFSRALLREVGSPISADVHFWLSAGCMEHTSDITITSFPLSLCSIFFFYFSLCRGNSGLAQTCVSTASPISFVILLLPLLGRNPFSLVHWTLFHFRFSMLSLNFCSCSQMGNWT